MTHLQRVLQDKRAILIPLLLALAANIAVYFLVVRPLAIKSTSVAERAQAASLNVRAAEREYAAAQALVTGKSDAERELSAFYDTVIPADQSAARRLTFAALPALAKKTNVKYDTRQTNVEDVKERQSGKERLGQLRITMALEGDYQNFRRFIYELETSPAFIIIDNVTLSEADPNKPLVFTLELSTYFRMGSNGD